MPQDFVLAYLWSSLAAAHAGKLADESAGREYKVEAEDAIDAQNLMDARNNLAALMTREQIAEAQKLVREWKPVFEEGYVCDLHTENLVEKIGRASRTR
jgi:hypothetical protein